MAQMAANFNTALASFSLPSWHKLQLAANKSSEDDTDATNGVNLHLFVLLDALLKFAEGVPHTLSIVGIKYDHLHLDQVIKPVYFSTLELLHKCHL